MAQMINQISNNLKNFFEQIGCDLICRKVVSRRRRQWHPTPVLLPGKSHGRRRLVGCSPQGHQGSDTTEQLRFHFSLSCIGKGNGNPLHCSCLENPRDGGAWWAAVFGVTQSRTQLKRLSSSSNHQHQWFFMLKYTTILNGKKLRDFPCSHFYKKTPI